MMLISISHVILYDTNAELWQDGSFDCQMQLIMWKKGATRSESNRKFIASTKGAKYVAVIIMVLTGDSSNASIWTVSELSNYINGNFCSNSTSTRKRHYLQYYKFENDSNLWTVLEAYGGGETCTDFVGSEL